MAMTNPKFIIFVLCAVVLIVYLFVTAPPPLPEHASSGIRLPIREVLQLANEENKVARALYTKQIVQAGKKQGLKFDEQWQEKSVIAGPLPAQFLRETAAYLEKTPVRLGLYLGSDYPINKVNQLSGEQLNIYNTLKQQRKDHFFHLKEDQTYVYMSPDIAIARACVDCHNDHKETPKSDWRLDDVMGATTWLYPDETISLLEALNLLQELRNGFRFAYGYFLSEVKQLPSPPVIGKRWPKEGYFVPAETEFMHRLSNQASSRTMSKLMQLVNKQEVKSNQDVKSNKEPS